MPSMLVPDIRPMKYSSDKSGLVVILSDCRDLCALESFELFEDRFNGREKFLAVLLVDGFRLREVDGVGPETVERIADFHQTRSGPLVKLENRLIELDQEENVEQAMEWLEQAPPALEDSHGDQHTYDVCCMLRDFGLSEAQALTVLHESGWNARSEPPWDLGHLEVKIKNSFAFGQNRPGCKAETLRVDRLKAARAARPPVPSSNLRQGPNRRLSRGATEGRV